jgi:hypothetical protein
MKSFLAYLSEARSHPELNPKVSAYEQIKQYSKMDDIYITFTDIEKVGINPQSKYNTPNGIYTYPLKEVWKKYPIDQMKSLKVLPFAAEKPFINVLKGRHSKGFVQNLYKDYTSADYDRDIEKLGKMFIGSPNLFDYIVKDVTAHAREKNAVSSFWYLTMMLAKMYQKNFDLQGMPAQAWNNLLRRLGYTGFGDKSGRGIIHPNEPMQAVFLTTSEFTLLARIDNKDYKKPVPIQRRIFPEIMASQLSPSNVSFEEDRHVVVRNASLKDFFKINSFDGVLDNMINHEVIDTKFMISLEFENCEIYGGFIPSRVHFKNCKIVRGKFVTSETYRDSFLKSEIIKSDFSNALFNGESEHSTFVDCNFTGKIELSGFTFKECEFLNDSKGFVDTCHIKDCKFSKASSSLYFNYCTFSIEKFADKKFKVPAIKCSALKEMIENAPTDFNRFLNENGLKEA